MAEPGVTPWPQSLGGRYSRCPQLVHAAMAFGESIVSWIRCTLCTMIKRRFPRYRVDRPVRAIMAPNEPSNLPLNGRCRVLSEGGLDVILPEHLSPGRTLYLELAPSLKVCATVRNRRSFHYGFEFIQLNDSERGAIKRLLESYPPSRQL